MSFFQDVIVKRAKASAKANAKLSPAKRKKIALKVGKVLTARAGKGKSCKKFIRDMTKGNYARAAKRLDRLVY